MSAPKSTPGPWQSFAGKATVGVARNAGTDMRLIAEMNRDLPEAEANARLIAAAPEILAALKELVRRCDTEEGVLADGSNIQTMQAHAAIAKAEGRGE